MRELPYDTLRGSTPIGLLVVHPSLPVKSAKELVALAKHDQVLYASSGAGSFSHLAVAFLTSRTDTRMLHVPYKGGGAATTALVSGETQFLAGSPATVVPHLASKRLRLLAVTSDTRLPQFPDAPTVAQSGVPGYEFRAWVALFGQKVLDAPDLRLDAFEPWYMTPDRPQPA